MKVFFLLIVVSFSLVECCKDTNKGDKDYGNKCEEWWNNVMNVYKKNSDIRRCVELIRDKCSTFLVIKNDITVTQEVWRYSIKWTITNKACLARDENIWVHYRIHKKTGVCKDDKAPANCNFWWHAATVLKDVPHVVERCFNLIRQKCPDALTQKPETREIKNHILKVVTVITQTYVYRGGEELTLRRYE